MARVLVIDDDHAQRFLFAQLLRRANFEIVDVESGEAALDVLASDSRFDVVLTDMEMQGLCGTELVRELRQQYPHLPVVLMSVSAPGEWKDSEIIASSIYLHKPFDRQQVVDALFKAIGK